jgi:hypothetical protein
MCMKCAVPKDAFSRKAALGKFKFPRHPVLYTWALSMYRMFQIRGNFASHTHILASTLINLLILLLQKFLLCKNYISTHEHSLVH